MDTHLELLEESSLRFDEIGPEDFSEQEFLLLVSVFEQLSKWSQVKDGPLTNTHQCAEKKADAGGDLTRKDV